MFVRPAAEARPAAGRERLRILEVGFGRGLNTACALAELARAGFAGEVQALGLEPNPGLLVPWPERPAELPAPWWGRPPGPWRLPDRPWSGEVRPAAAPEGLPPGFGADWIFLDLFSPGAHPEDWRPGLAPALARAAAPGAVLTTYTCARVVRDRLAEAGWRVERRRRAGRKDHLRAVLAGPPPLPPPSPAAATA